MEFASRLIVLGVVFAHLWAGAMPCASRLEAADRIAMTTAEAESLLQSARSAPPCHDEEGEGQAAAAAVTHDTLLFFLPACPCGCDQRAPAGGSSTVRVGAGVPPGSLLAQADPQRVEPLVGRVPTAPLGIATLPEPVPRRHSLA